MSAPILEARGLSIGWGRGRRAEALAAGIDLELRPGELAALIGPNGSGKSTLLRTLVGHQAPLAGELRLQGDDPRSLPVEQRARRVASVFTGSFDSGWFTVFDIVAFGRYPFTDARNRLSAQDRAAVAEALEAVGLAGMAHRRFGELSDGERQKAHIARAVAQDCPLLALDEPTAFLDAGARIEVFSLALRLSRERGKAVVISTHDLDLALGSADRLWLFDRGHRFESGCPEQLALGGAVGRAFDGTALRFDLMSGSFRPSHERPKVLVSVEGEGPEAAWAERLALRLGLGLAREAEPGAAPAAVVVAGRGPGQPRYSMRDATSERGLDTIEELAAALRNVARGT